MLAEVWRAGLRLTPGEPLGADRGGPGSSPARSGAGRIRARLRRRAPPGCCGAGASRLTIHLASGADEDFGHRAARLARRGSMSRSRPRTSTASMQRAARGLAREMRLPGFRKGKAPPSLVIQRLGRGAVLEQAMRDALPEWYERALLDSGVSPVGDPDIEVTSIPETEGEPLEFKFEVGVRPEAELGDYKGLEVGQGRPRGPRRRHRPRAGADARGLRQARPGRARRRRGRRPAGRLRGHDRRRAVRGRRGARLPAGAGRAAG